MNGNCICTNVNGSLARTYISPRCNMVKTSTSQWVERRWIKETLAWHKPEISPTRKCHPDMQTSNYVQLLTKAEDRHTFYQSLCDCIHYRTQQPPSLKLTFMMNVVKTLCESLTGRFAHKGPVKQSFVLLTWCEPKRTAEKSSQVAVDLRCIDLPYVHDYEIWTNYDIPH